MEPEPPDASTTAALERRLAYVSLLERAATAANDSDTLDGAARVVVDEVCRLTGWPLGVLRAGASRNGKGLTERVLESGEPQWTDDVGSEPIPADAGAAVASSVRAAAGFPIRAGDEVAAVLVFYSSDRRGPDPALTEVMVGVGERLGRVVDRQRAVTTLRRDLETRLAERALRDDLTGLPNRGLLLDRMDHALKASAARGRFTAVLWLDLDRFKAVNDELGRETGDELLRTVAGRLQTVVRPGDTLARIAGDEFAVLWEDLPGSGEAVELAEEVFTLFRDPFDAAGREVTVGVSGGVAVAASSDDADGGHAEMLMREAGAAMYRAKQGGRNRFEVFDEAMLAAAARRQATERDLRRAIDRGELSVHYQPIMALATGALAGVEALVRWNHPERGLVPPGDFIPLAEEAGLIGDLGRWVLTEACAQAAQWEAVRRGQFTLSVNVSAHQFEEQGWTEEVAASLAAAGLEPRRLVLEVTESVLAKDAEAAARRLGQLRTLGTRIAIDDFGTGYSSLGYLRDLPVDILKIDKSFIDGVTEGPHESALARAVVKLTKTLGLVAVAEGIEREDQLVRLRRLGCQYGQGFYLGRPEPAAKIDQLLSGRSTDPSL